MEAQSPDLETQIHWLSYVHAASSQMLEKALADKQASFKKAVFFWAMEVEMRFAIMEQTRWGE